MAKKKKDPFGDEEDLPLFDDLRYPSRPGYKDPGTSKDAAREMHVPAHNLRLQVYAEIKRSKALTADEVAFALGESRLSIRPRLSELRLRQLIIPSGKYRKNKSGKRAIVWQLANAPSLK